MTQDHVGNWEGHEWLKKEVSGTTLYDQILTPWVFRCITQNSVKDRKRRFRLQIPALISEKFKSKKVKYANELTDDVTLTQYYTKFLNRAILANLQCRPLTWQANSSTENTPIASYKIFCSHGNSLFSSPHPLDFNM